MRNEQTVREGIETTRVKQAWEPMEIRFEGDSSELIQSGTKSGIGGDPGDGFKPPGQEA